MSQRESLNRFLQTPVNTEMVQLLVTTTESVIRLSRHSYPSPPNSPNAKVPSLEKFIMALITHSNVQTPTLMSALVFLCRLRDVLPPRSHGMETTHHRIFLGTLITAAKTLNDSSPLNKHWAHYTDGLLSVREVNTVEREILNSLQWNLSFSTKELYNVLSPLLYRDCEPIRPSSTSVSLNSHLRPLQTSRSSNSVASSVPSLISSTSTNSNLSLGSRTMSRPRLNDIQEEHTPREQEDDFCFKPRPLRLKKSFELNKENEQMKPKNRQSLLPSSRISIQI